LVSISHDVPDQERIQVSNPIVAVVQNCG